MRKTLIFLIIFLLYGCSKESIGSLPNNLTLTEIYNFVPSIYLKGAQAVYINEKGIEMIVNIGPSIKAPYYTEVNGEEIVGEREDVLMLNMTHPESHVMNLTLFSSLTVGGEITPIQSAHYYLATPKFNNLITAVLSLYKSKKDPVFNINLDSFGLKYDNLIKFENNMSSNGSIYLSKTHGLVGFQGFQNEFWILKSLK